MKEYTNLSKIPSALITNEGLVTYARQNSDTLIVSTGMSDESRNRKLYSFLQS